MMVVRIRMDIRGSNIQSEGDEGISSDFNSINDDELRGLDYDDVVPFRLPSGLPPEGVVRVVALPTACTSIIFHLQGVSYVGSGGRPLVEGMGRTKLMRIIYGVRGHAPHNVMGRYQYIKRAVLTSIPIPGYKDGYVFLQYAPMVRFEGFPVSTIATRIILVSYDIVPPERKVAEAVAAALAFLANRYGTAGIGEAMNVNALRPVLGPEEGTPTAYVTARAKRTVKARVWRVKNLPPLPKVEYYRAPPKHKVSKR